MGHFKFLTLGNWGPVCQVVGNQGEMIKVFVASSKGKLRLSSARILRLGIQRICYISRTPIRTGQFWDISNIRLISLHYPIGGIQRLPLVISPSKMGDLCCSPGPQMTPRESWVSSATSARGGHATVESMLLSGRQIPRRLLPEFGKSHYGLLPRS